LTSSSDTLTGDIATDGASLDVFNVAADVLEHMAHPWRTLPNRS
jgi:hypothetical protein